MLRRYALILLLSVSFLASAQTHEFGGWLSTNATLGVTDGLSFTIRGEYRTRNAWTKTDLFFGRFTASYKFCPYFTLGTSYENLNIKDAATNDYTMSHRLFANASGSYSVSNFSITLLERFVYAYTPKSEQHSSYTLRSMLTLAYQVEDYNLRPYVAAELFNDLEVGHHFNLRTTRFYTGLRYDCNEHNAFQVFYCCQTKVAAKENIHSLGIDYFFNWKLKNSATK